MLTHFVITQTQILAQVAPQPKQKTKLKKKKPTKQKKQNNNKKEKGEEGASLFSGWTEEELELIGEM